MRAQLQAVPAGMDGDVGGVTPYGGFPWPTPEGAAAAPVWTGGRFVLGTREERVLRFTPSESSWSDDLTALHEAEAGENHPIDIASRSFAIDTVRRYVKVPQPLVLDVGSSSGFMLDLFRRELPDARLIGSDFIVGPLLGLGARLPEVPLLQFDLRICPLADRCVDAVTSLNVLEHIDDHSRALGHMFRVLKAGGIAHVEVPAAPGLYDIYDEHLMHHRRYRMRDLVSMAKSTGFEVLVATHLGVLVFPPFWIVKKRNRRLLSLPAEKKAEIVAAQIRNSGNSGVMRTLMRWERTLGAFVRFPFGIRCVVVLRKPT